MFYILIIVFRGVGIGSFFGCAMGALVDGHFDEELENGLVLGVSCEPGIENEPETKVIQDAVKVLLLGLGEDINREGLRKTPFRVAKALREGTRGAEFFIFL